MTDDEVDALLHPPRQWPPLSAVGAAGLLLMPPVWMAGVAFALGRWAELVIPFVGFLIVIRPAVNLLRGNVAGIGGGLGVLALVAVVCGIPVAFALLNGQADLGLIQSALPVVCWLGLAGFLIWWPATRRWCGFIAPAALDDED